MHGRFLLQNFCTVIVPQIVEWKENAETKIIVIIIRVFKIKKADDILITEHICYLRSWSKKGDLSVLIIFNANVSYRINYSMLDVVLL